MRRAAIHLDRLEPFQYRSVERERFFTLFIFVFESLTSIIFGRPARPAAVVTDGFGL